MLVDYWYCRKTRVDENLQNNRNHFKSKEYMCKNFDTILQQLNQCIPSKIINEQEECQKVMMDMHKSCLNSRYEVDMEELCSTNNQLLFSSSWSLVQGSSSVKNEISNLNKGFTLIFPAILPCIFFI